MFVEKNLARYFPPAKMRNDITQIMQSGNQSLYDAWEKYKDMLRRCLHHGLPEWLQVQTFYNGLNPQTRTVIDAGACGALMGKTIGEAFHMLEVMASNNYQWPNERATKKAVGVYALDGFFALTAKVDSLYLKLDTFSINVVQSMQVCDLCGGPHQSVDCQVGNPFAPSSTQHANYVLNCSRQHNNLYSNTYNPSWKNHLNFSLNNNQRNQKPLPSGFQQNQQQQLKKKSSLEDTLTQLSMTTQQLSMITQ